MSFTCPRCEGAKETPVLAYCHCANPVELCRCPEPELEQCSRCKGTGYLFCEACNVQSATVATPFRPGSSLMCHFCGPCAAEDGGHQADVDRTLEERHLPEFEP